MKLKNNAHIALGLSGGKDSIVTLKLLWEIFGRFERGPKISSISVDEGIKDYRDESIKIGKSFSQSLEVEHHVVKFKELFGFEMDDVAKHKREKTPCSYCGVLRRNALNRKAKELGADFLATGLNLDDTAQSILMNFVKGDIKRMARLGPHKIVKKGLIPRIQPLRVIPEKEVYLYAYLEGLKFHKSICPYAKTAQRNIFREIIEKLEEKTPGTRHAILRSFDLIHNPILKQFPDAGLKLCKCGEPASGDVCMACLFKGEILEKMKSL